MPSHGRPLFMTLAICLLIRASAFAADTGSVSGTVFDQAGKPIADVLVKISGDRLPVGRSSQTDANGAFRFEYLLPGTYTVDFEKSGVGSTKRAAIVDVDKDTQVDIVLGMAVKEEVTVTAATSVVDVKSAEVSFNFKSDTVDSLPLERTYRGLFQLIPGVPENRSTVGPAAGGDRQDNAYLIDGANITNPGFGYLSTEVNELDIAEVNIKRAGVNAEFGRTVGTVMNAVSRSGSNRLSGMGRIDWLPNNLTAGYKLSDDLRNLDLGIKPGTFRDPILTTETSPAVGIGGPILKDHLFFYGSARYFRETKPDRTNKAGTSLPDERRSGRELYGKLTGTPTASHQLNFSFRDRPNHVDDASLGAGTAPSIATTTDNSSRVASAQWAYFMSARSSLDVRYLYSKENNEDVPVTSLGYLPTFDPNSLSAMGQYTDQITTLTVGGNQYINKQDYRRHELRGTFTQFFDLGRSSHALKAGAGYEFGEENLNRLGNGWGMIVNVTPGGVPALRARYYTKQPSQLGQGRTYSLFVQDDITIAGRVTVNAGLLANRDEFAQRLAGSGGCPSTVTLKGGDAVYQSSGDTCTFLRFGFGEEMQPRLGVSYQLREKKGDKVYANFGRYSNMDQKSSGRSLAPSRIFQTETVFDASSGAVLSTGPLASTTGKMIDPDIKPTYTNEVLVGYATPFAPHFSADVFFMYRNINNVIEDTPSRQNGSSPTSGPFVAVNLPCTRFAACAGDVAKRTYRAVTLEVRRQLADSWSANVSYTWSRFKGNYDLDYSGAAVFNTSSFIQDGPGTDVQDPNRFGPLNEDRPHVFKLFTSYLPISALTASAYVRIQSGSPWNARARDWPGGVLNYLEPAGSHRNPTWTNLDLMANYRLPFGGRTNVSLEARLLNVLNNQTRLTTDSQQFTDLVMILMPPYFGPYQLSNRYFGTGNGFAPPRRLYIAAIVSF
jgi:hypothetical protein